MFILCGGWGTYSDKGRKEAYLKLKNLEKSKTTLRHIFPLIISTHFQSQPKNKLALSFVNLSFTKE